MAEVTGAVSTQECGGDLVVEWSIGDFSSLRKNDGAMYVSPRFSFGGERRYLYICPNGFSATDSSGHLDLRLFRWSSGPSIGVSVSISLKTAEGRRHGEVHGTGEFRAFPRFMPRSELLRRESELLPDGVLTVVCTLKSTAAECRHCKEIFTADSLSSHQKQCKQRPTKCPDCSEVVLLEQWLNAHDCQQARAEGAISKCPHCRLTMEETNLPTHEKSCAERPVRCPQCGEDVASKLWLEHTCLTARTNAIGNLLHDFKRLLVSGEL